MPDLIKVQTEEVKRENPGDIKQPIIVSEVNSKDDKEYTVEIVRDFYGQVDPFYLSQKDPEYAYRFLRDDQKNISTKTHNLLFQKGGWQLCPKAHLLRIGIKERELFADGLLRRGDTVLAFMPKKLFEEKEQYKIKQANEPMKMIARKLKEGDSSVGGKDIHETMRGIETAEQLRMK